MLQDFSSVSDHFGTLCIKGLIIGTKSSILDACGGREYGYVTYKPYLEMVFSGMLMDNERVVGPLPQFLKFATYTLQ